MQTLALHASKPHAKGDRYEMIGEIFIDGFEFNVLHVPKRAANQNLSQLRDKIQNQFVDKTVKNLLLTERPNGTFFWVTLTPDSS